MSMDALDAAAHASLLLRKAVVSKSAATGGRAVFATEDIRAGELIAAECPTMEHLFAVEGECQHVSLARRILDLPDDDPRWACVRLLHPRSLESLPQPKRAAYTDQVRTLQATLVTKSRSADEILLVLLKSRMNVFSSGMYLHFSMLNHSCKPNAVKLAPNKRDPQLRSRLHALRPISRGEEVTITYLDTRLKSRAARAAELIAQHHFDLEAESPWLSTTLELAGADAATLRDASACEALVDRLSAQLARGLAPRREHVATLLRLQRRFAREGDPLRCVALDGDMFQDAVGDAAVAVVPAVGASLVGGRISEVQVKVCKGLLERTSASASEAGRLQIVGVLLASCIHLVWVYARLLCANDADSMGAMPLGDADACDIALVELYEDIANSIEILLLVKPEGSSPAPFRLLWPDQVSASAAAAAFMAAAQRLHELYASDDAISLDPTVPRTLDSDGRSCEKRVTWAGAEDRAWDLF
jgi:hypothetical protein